MGQARPTAGRLDRRGLPDPQVHQGLPGHQDLEARQVHRDHQGHRDRNPRALLGRPDHRVREEPRAPLGHRPDHPACRAGEEAPAGALEVEILAEGQADVEEW